MIPETRDYFAVFTSPDAGAFPESADYFERPVLAWDDLGYALVAHTGPGHGRLSRAAEAPNFAGLRGPAVSLADFMAQHDEALTGLVAGRCERGRDGTFTYF